jgi:TonB-dependent SusC/RagA subfamily outer membrane receptor
MRRMKIGFVVLLGCCLWQFDALGQAVFEEDSVKTIRIHCAPSIPNSFQPLYVVNGVEYSRRKIKKINTHNIQKISVVKGPDAVALYGVRGEFGVILIELKKKRSGRRGQKQKGV